MQNILITGYTGFIGSYLADNLINSNLYGVDLAGNDSVVKHFQWHELEECSGEECIIHLAGKAHDTQNVGAEDDYYEINVGLTEKIFRHFLKSGASKFIFFSSIKAVADVVEGDQLTEDILPNPKTPYGKSKLIAEKFLLTEFEKWKKEQILSGEEPGSKKVYILRPCMIYGPGNKGNLSLLLKLQQRGLPWPLGAFENKRTFCSIRNILFVIQKLIDENIEPGIYQVADDESISTNDLVNLIANALDKKARIMSVSPGLIKIIAKVGDILHLPLNSERLKKLTETYIVSNQKLKDALSIQNMPFALSESMELTIKSLNIQEHFFKLQRKTGFVL